MCCKEGESLSIMQRAVNGREGRGPEGEEMGKGWGTWLIYKSEMPPPPR